jgi:hypothetical protein
MAPNAERGRAAFHRWRKEHPDFNMVQRYGISQDEYDAILAGQGGVCRICGESGVDKSHARLVIDHDEASNSIRGLVCARCNLGLGAFRHSPMILRAAAEYLDSTTLCFPIMKPRGYKRRPKPDVEI